MCVQGSIKKLTADDQHSFLYHTVKANLVLSQLLHFLAVSFVRFPIFLLAVPSQYQILGRRNIKMAFGLPSAVENVLASCAMHQVFFFFAHKAAIFGVFFCQFFRRVFDGILCGAAWLCCCLCFCFYPFVCHRLSPCWDR